MRKSLQRRGLYTTWAPPNGVAGLTLQRDLRILIDSKTPVCIDVGGNKGQTVDLLRSALDNPTVHVFEPTRHLYELLVKKYPGSNTHIHHLALGDAEGEAELQCYSADDMNSLLPLQKDSHHYFQNMSSSGTEKVRICTLDSLLPTFNLDRIDLLKVDTQGFDGRVLKGAENLLSSGNVTCVMVEINFVQMYEGQSRASDILQFLLDHGYRPVDLYEKVRTKQDIAWCTGLFVNTK